jgi:hypothetical protein
MTIMLKVVLRNEIWGVDYIDLVPHRIWCLVVMNAIFNLWALEKPKHILTSWAVTRFSKWNIFQEWALFKCKVMIIFSNFLFWFYGSCWYITIQSSPKSFSQLIKRIVKYILNDLLAEFTKTVLSETVHIQCTTCKVVGTFYKMTNVIHYLNSH